MNTIQQLPCRVELLGTMQYVFDHHALFGRAQARKRWGANFFSRVEHLASLPALTIRLRAVKSNGFEPDVRLHRKRDFQFLHLDEV